MAFRERSLNASPSDTSTISPNHLVHFSHVAAVVVTLYDHLITLDKEVEYIWNKKRSKSKILYLLARYFGDALLISICVGEIGLTFVGTGAMIIIITTQYIMKSRVRVLYGELVSTFLTIFWAMEVVALVTLGVASLAAIDVHVVVRNTTRMCDPTYLPPFAVLFWLPVIMFEGVLFLLALRIAYRNYCELGTWYGVSLLYVILRDNFSFFACALALYIINATTWLTANPRYSTVPGSFSCSLSTVMACRLILNLCEAYYHPSESSLHQLGARPQSIWTATTSGGNIFFGRPGPSSGTSDGNEIRGMRTWAAGPTRSTALRLALTSGGTSTGKTTLSSVGAFSSSESEGTEAEVEMVEADARADEAYSISLVSRHRRRGEGANGSKLGDTDQEQGLGL